MSPARAQQLATTFVQWLVRRGGTISLVTALVLVASAYLITFHLPLYADFSHLLPQDSRAVRDLRALEARVAAPDTVLVVLAGRDAAAVESAAGWFARELPRLPSQLVGRVELEDAETRSFLRARKHLFVPLAELTRARDALKERIEQEKIAANPLFIDLDEEDRAAERDKVDAELNKLRQQRKEAEARLDRSSFRTADGKTGLIVVRTAFPKTDAASGERLVNELSRLRAAAMAAVPGIDIGLTGGVISAAAEHEALVRGMMLSSILTAALVGLVLLLYFRSAYLLFILSGALIVGTAAAFGAAALTVGHLNAATAFLGAIIAGNGVNYGILLIARFLEERRHHDPATAMATAVHKTMRPTIVASLGAAIAYGSLAATSFRGFADFAVIGAIGMILCWLATYFLVPPLVLRFASHTTLSPGEPILGRVLASALGFRRPALVCTIAAGMAVGAGWLSYRYVAEDPFEYDIKNLRSEGDDAVLARKWLAVSDAAFGRGISGQTFIAAQRPEQVPRIVEAIRKIDAGKPDGEKTIGAIRSILDVVPEQQAEKLVVLSEIRELLADDALEALSDDERRELESLKPPADLQAITPASLPAELADKLRERDGRIGLLIGVRPANALDEWDGRDLIRFATAIRSLELADGERITTSGASVIFADIVASIEQDGPKVTAIAALTLCLMVVLVVGPNRRAAAVMVATGLGALALVAACALIDLKVNFLDFVALPITLGLGVDYAINVAHRYLGDERATAHQALRTSGSAVFVCSLTTIIGYGSLLVSENLAIRGFGEASLIGEVACVLTALIAVPALLSLRRGS